MTLLTSVHIGLTQLRINKLRSLLTLLGMIIGVGSVIGVVSIGAGLQRTVFDEFGKMGGANLIWVSALRMVVKDGRWVQAPVYEPLTLRDVGYIEAVSDRIAAVVPIAGSRVDLRYRKASYTGQLEGTIPAYSQAYSWAIEEGRFLSGRDVDRWRTVCVLGREAVEKLFGEEWPLGHEVKLDGHRYTIVGVMEERESFGNTWGNRVLVPVTTAQKRLLGNDEINTLIVVAKELESVQRIAEAIEKALYTHHSKGTEYRIQSGQSILDQVGQTIFVMQMVVGGIAGISLLVGGIGIMNMMLVSVTERTREIGIRKAVGAKRSHMLFQFTMEAIMLSLMGGILGVFWGIGLGLGISKLIEYFSDAPFPSVVSPAAVALALGVSIAIGLFFGIYPAVRASRLNPIDALKYE